MYTNIIVLQCQLKYNNSDLVLQSMYIIIVLVFCVNVMAINVIVNQAKKRVAVNMRKRLSQKSRKLQSYVRSRLSKKVLK